MLLSACAASGSYFTLSVSSPSPPFRFAFFSLAFGTTGYFSGQTGYGYRSFEAFVDAVREIESGATTAEVNQAFSFSNRTGQTSYVPCLQRQR